MEVIPDLAYANACLANLATLAALSMVPSSQRIPQCPWMVYAQMHTCI
jgi:hypothetical protein